MGYFIPSLLAFILNSCGVYVFNDVNIPGNEPLISSLIFLFGIFLLVWDIRLFPSSLRKIWKVGAYLYQFLISVFLMEHIMNDFWFPLETSIGSGLPKIAEFEQSVLTQSGLTSTGVLQCLKDNMAHVIVSYLLSVFSVVSIAHCTRLIDLRLLKCGVAVFGEDLRNRAEKEFRKFKKLVVSEHRKNVKFRSRNSYADECEEYMDNNYCGNPEDDYKKGRRCRYY